MSVSAEEVRRLREMTGAGMMDCKRALEESGGDLDRAVEVLRRRGMASAQKRSGRVAREGLIDAYIHMNGRLGVLVEVNCETDFVANTEEFRTLVHEVALQVAANTATRWISRDEVPADLLDSERKVYEEQAHEQGKREDVIPRIVEGKLETWYREAVLLDQPWIRDDSKTLGQLVGEVSAKVGEKIEVRRFARFVLGEEIR